jgi:hypothetical protein
MSKWLFAVIALAFGMVAVAKADDIYRVYNFGSGALYGPVNDPYGGGAPAGMRYGDPPQVGGNGQTFASDCPSCIGITPHPCDPCWRGPCIDWKLIGWYSHWGDPHGCHRKRCCASLGNCGPGQACGPGQGCPSCDANVGACVTCNQ